MRNIMKSPEWVLLLTQTFSTISFAVLYSSLVLFMTEKAGMSQTEANTIMGLFLAFNYGLHLLGTCVGGRLMSYRGLFIAGMLLQVFACILLATSPHYLIWGLTAFLTGSGLNVPCINMMLTQQFQPKEVVRREKSFMWNYAGMNIGFILGLSLAGALQLHQAFSLMFIWTTGSNIFAMILVFLGWGAVKDQGSKWVLAAQKKHSQLYRSICGGLVIVGVFVALRFLLTMPMATDIAGLSIGAIMLLTFLILSFTQKNKKDGQRLLAYVLLAFFSLIFWSLYNLAPMGLTFFAEYNVNRAFFGTLIGPQWILNINSIVIAIGGFALPAIFLFIRKRIQLSLPFQFTLALFLMSAGYLVLPIGIHYASVIGLSSILWITLSYVFQSVGELMLSPVGYAMVGQLATTNLQGLMMGSWMLLTSSTAGIIASYLSNWAAGNQTSTNPLVTNPTYSHAFLSMGLACAGVGVVLCLLIPFIRKLINDDVHLEPPHVEH